MSDEQRQPMPSHRPAEEVRGGFLTDVAVGVTTAAIVQGAPYLARVVTNKLTPHGQHARPSGDGDGGGQDGQHTD
jgi:hypothetical protein